MWKGILPFRITLSNPLEQHLLLISSLNTEAARKGWKNIKNTQELPTSSHNGLMSFKLCRNRTRLISFRDMLEKEGTSQVCYHTCIPKLKFLSTKFKEPNHITKDSQSWNSFSNNCNIFWRIIHVNRGQKYKCEKIMKLVDII